MTSVSRRLCWLIGVWLAFSNARAAEMRFVTEPFDPFVTAGTGDKNADMQQAVGPLVDIVQAACQRINISCSVTMFPWRRAFYMAKEGRVEGILPIAKASDRERFFFFSDTVIESASSVFVQSASTLTAVSLTDLDKYNVGVYGPSAASAKIEPYFRAGSTGKVDLAVSNLTVLKMLAGNRYGGPEIGIGVMNREVGRQLLDSGQVKGVKYLNDLSKTAIGIGLSRKNVSETQFNAFNDALKALIHEGKIKAILVKYKIELAS